MAEPVWLPVRAMRALIEEVNDAVLITDAKDLAGPGPAIIYANPAFYRISGYRADEVVGRNPRFLQGPGTDSRALARISAALNSGTSCREEVLNYSKDGRPYWLDIHIVPLRGDDGSIQYFGAIERDVTEQRSVVETLERLAHEDILTGLGNRAALDRHLRTMVDAAFCLLFDLDGFKAINDTLGHLAGDNILRHFASYVISALRRDDFMVRLGGDEFVVILKGYTQAESVAFAERVVANLATMKVSGSDRIGVSVGMSAITVEDTMETILAKADAALYQAKAAGKGTVRLHEGKSVA